MSDLSSTSITNYGNRSQLLGLGSSFDTQSMLQLELDILEMRKQPYASRVQSLEKEKSAWNAFQNSLNNFNKLVEDLKDFSSANKSVNFDSEGFFTANATNETVSGNYDIEINQIATAQRIMSDQLGEGPLGLNETTEINGKEIEITEDMDARDIALKINGGDYGVSAVILDNRLVMTSNETGIENDITLGNSNLFEVIGITSGNSIKNELQAAQNAIFKINGVEMESQINTINEVEGLTLSLKQKTNGTVNFSVEKSTDELIEKAGKVAEGYNSLMKTIQTLNGQEGVLQGETIPRKLKMNLGNIISGTTIDGNTFNAIGLGFDRDTGNGMIKLDETKLKEAFESDPDKVIEMLSGKEGFAAKVYDTVEKFSSSTGMIETEKTGIDNRIERFNTTIERFDMSFERQKESLLRKYAKLDVLMSQLEAQRSYIDAQLGQFEIDANK